LRLQRQFEAQSQPLRPCHGRDNNAIGTQLSGGVFQRCPDAKNDDRRFGYDAGECPEVLPKRKSGWPQHRTAFGKAMAAALAKPAAAANGARTAGPASTPESRSAAALALSREPTFDEGTAQRIKDAALS
jgi:hypothetical protein